MDTLTDKVPDIEEEIKKEEEVEDLSQVDMGLDGEGYVNIMAQERWQVVQSYQRLYVRGLAVNASIRINANAGNTEGVKRFENDAKELDLQIAHCKRGVKAIDKECSKAKGRMQEMIEEAQRRPPACPRCGQVLR